MSLKVLSIVVLCAVAYIVEGKTAHGGACSFSVDCESGLRCDRTYTTCSKGTCICETGKMLNIDGKCGSLLGGACAGDTDCSVGKGYCNIANQKCECAAATPMKATDKFCVRNTELEMNDQCSINKQYYYIAKYDTKGTDVYIKTTPGPCGCPDDRYKQENRCLPQPGNLIERARCSQGASRQCVEGLDCAQCGGETQYTCRKPFGGQVINIKTGEPQICPDTSRAAVSVIVAGLLLSLSTMM